MGPEASVIVALNPHEGGIDPVLDGYRAQAGVDARFELIVVDNGSRPALARPAAPTDASVRVRWVASSKPGRAAANNAGVRASSAPTLIFVADDFIPSPSLVRAHLEFQRTLDGPAVGIGPAFFTPDCRGDPFRRWLEDSGRLFGVPFRTVALKWPRDFLYLGNASMSRELYDALGGFDERFEFDLFDDLDFSLRMAERGVESHLLPKALAWHDHPVTIEERLVAMHRSGQAARRHDRWHGGARPWRGLTEVPVASLEARVAPGCPADASLPRRFDHYSALVDLAFVRGYHDLAVRAGGPEARLATSPPGE